MAHTILSEQDRKALVAWHKGLDDGQRGDRAMLRRANAPEDILLTPAFAHFLQKMPKEWVDSYKNHLLDAAIVASTVARVKQNETSHITFARALATPVKSGASKAAMSELRFQQLQKSRTPEDFFRRMKRAIDLLGGKVDVCSLTEDILLWLREYRYGPSDKPQDRLAIRWASDYYQYLRD